MGQNELQLSYAAVVETAQYSTEAIAILNSSAYAGLQNIYEIEDLLPDDYYDLFGVYANENTYSHLGRYQENWDDNSSSGWSSSGNISNTSYDGYYTVTGNYCCNNPGYDHTISSPTFNLDDNFTVDSLSVDFVKSSNTGGGSPYCYLEVRFNSDDWQTLYYNVAPSIPWTNLSVDFSTIEVPSNASTMAFRARSRFLRLRDFAIR